MQTPGVRSLRVDTDVGVLFVHADDEVMTPTIRQSLHGRLAHPEISRFYGIVIQISKTAHGLGASWPNLKSRDRTGTSSRVTNDLSNAWPNDRGPKPSSEAYCSNASVRESRPYLGAEGGRESQ